MEQNRGRAAAPFRTRPDLSPNLLHLTRGESRAAAFGVLRTIVAERQLRGGDGYIRGGFRCVCFTEAPIAQLANIFRWSEAKPLRFQPYGVLLGKEYLFALGGRPVIYQPDSEYHCLPDEIKYRHVRYDPIGSPPVDFTWEREWRIRTDGLALDPERCCLVVTGPEEREALRRDHAKREAMRIEALRQAVADPFGAYTEEEFPWQVVELGV